MVKINEVLEIPPVLTPEVVKAIAENAEALKTLKTVLSSGDEAMALKDDCAECDDCNKVISRCCCPKLVKFKIFAGTVIIINDNAECQKVFNSPL